MINIARGTRYKYEDYHKEFDGVLYKRCTLHTKYFPNEDEWILSTNEYFYTYSNNTGDGLHPECKKCGIKKSREIQLENYEDYLEYLKQWKINNPEYMPEYNKTYYAANMEKFYEKLVRWQQENPDRVKERNKEKRKHDITKNEWLACKDFFRDADGDYCCAYCGLKIQHHTNRFKNGFRQEDFAKEHVDDNGYNDVRNCVPSCKSCNSFKGSYDFDVWYCSDNPNWTQERYNKIIQWTTEEYKKYIEDKPPYKIKRQIIHNEDGTSYNQRQLWSVDEKRNLVNIIYTSNSIDEIKYYIKNNNINIVKS